MSYLPPAEKLAALNAGRIAGNLYALLLPAGLFTLRVGATAVRLRPAAPAGQPLEPSTLKTCETEAAFDAFLASLPTLP